MRVASLLVAALKFIVSLLMPFANFAMIAPATLRNSHRNGLPYVDTFFSGMKSVDDAMFRD
jgi:hypothetical protein